MVEVQTEALGLSAEGGRAVDHCATGAGPARRRSFPGRDRVASLPGLSSVLMTFEPGMTCSTRARSCRNASLRPSASPGCRMWPEPPQMIQPVSANRGVSMIKLSSEIVDSDRRVRAGPVGDRPRLMGVPGVANVTVWGFRDRQLQVLVDPERLQESGTTLAQVIDTAGNALEVSPLSFLEASTPGTGGFIDTVNQRLNIFHQLANHDGRRAVSGSPRKCDDGEADDDIDHAGRCHDGGGGFPTADRGAICPARKVPVPRRREVPRCKHRRGHRRRQRCTRRDAARPWRYSDRHPIYRPASFIESSFQNLGWALLAMEDAAVAGDRGVLLGLAPGPHQPRRPSPRRSVLPWPCCTSAAPP